MKVPGKAVGWAAAGAVAIAAPFIAGWEGKRNDPYRDIVGVWTVCYGETRANMRRYSDAECMEMLQRETGDFAEKVLQCTPSLQSRPYQLAAATSLAYNVGVGAYCRSTADRQFDAGDWRGGCDAILLWNKAGGRVVQGLVNRRKAERQLCLQGL